MAPSERPTLDQAAESLGEALAGLAPGETVAVLRRVFAGLDASDALSLAIAAVLGDSPDREVAVIDPKTGHVRAYLIPPAVAVARWAAWSREQPAPDRPPLSPKEFREVLASVGADPGVTVSG